MRQIGLYRTQSGEAYDLVYFEDTKKAQAIGPLPKRAGAAPIAYEVSAEDVEEAQRLLEAKINAKETFGPSIVAISTSSAGVTSIKTTPISPDLQMETPFEASRDATKHLIIDNPFLAPLTDELVKVMDSLLQKRETNRKITDSESRTGQTVINLKYSPIVYMGGGNIFGGTNRIVAGDLNIEDKSVHLALFSTLDLAKVVQELNVLIDALSGRQGTDLADVALLEKARSEAQKGNKEGTSSLLGKISKAAIDVSKEVGTKLLTEYVMKLTGMKA